MKNYVIPIITKYLNEDWISKNQTIAMQSKETVTSEYVKNAIEEGIQKANENKVEIHFYGIDTTKKEELIKTAYEYVKLGKIEEIKVITRPSAINKQFLKMLKKYKVSKIELEVGSTNEYILKIIEADYTLDTIKKAARAIKWKRFKLGYQVFVGLPESTKIDDVNTVKTLLKTKPKAISLTPVLVLKNTPLEKELENDKYKPLNIIQATEICEEIVKILNEKNIEIIAIGYGILDNDIEQLEIAGTVKSGPFHPSFRELVQTSLWYDAIVSKIKKLNVKVSEAEIFVNKIDVNNVIGYKQENINKLKEIYDVDLIITPDESIKPGKSRIEITKIAGKNK